MRNSGAGERSDQATPLPGFDGEGFFGIRLESIGGLGAHLAGQLLAEAAVLRQGVKGSHFSSYGPQKKGSPRKAHRRTVPGVVVVNSAASAGEVRRRFGLQAGTLGVVDALRIAVEEGSRVNTAMLGAIARVSPMLTRAAVGGAGAPP